MSASHHAPGHKSNHPRRHHHAKPTVAYKPTRGFEGVHHHWDAAANAWIVHILPGEFYVTNGPEIIATVLGSCVSTCIRDGNTGLGGMNHFMLPEDPRKDKRGDALRYGCFALERLIKNVSQGSGDRNSVRYLRFPWTTDDERLTDDVHL